MKSTNFFEVYIYNVRNLIAFSKKLQQLQEKKAFFDKKPPPIFKMQHDTQNYTTQMFPFRFL